MHLQGLHIRPIKPQDSSQIELLYQQSAKHLKSLGDTSEFLFDGQIYLRDGFGDNPAFFGIVAELNENLVGYLLYNYFYDTDQASRIMFILDVLVDQNHRQKGMGQALMQDAKRIATKQGAKHLFWAVYKHNSLAENFYTKLGAEKVEEVFFMTLPTKIS